MSLNVIKEEIEILVDTISEQYDVIKKYKSSIPQIEIDIMMANIRDLYVFIDELNKINKIKESFIENRMHPQHHEIKHAPAQKIEIEKPVEKEVVAEEIPVVSIIEEKVKEEIVSAEIKIYEGEVEEKKVEPEKTIEIQIEEKPVIEDEIKSTEIVIEEKESEKVIEEKPVASLEELFAPVKEVTNEKKETEKPKKHEKSSVIDLFAGSEKASVADKFKDDKVSLNQKLGEEKKEKTLADKMQKKPITDLKSAIGINDKFIFINDLFKGSLQEYNHSIEKMNACTTVEEAFKIIEEYKLKYSWDENHEVYAKLEDFIIRKFL